MPRSPFLYRLFALAAAAMLPLLALLGWHIWDDHRLAEAEAIESARRHALTMSQQSASTVEQSQQLLLFLAQRPEIRALDGPNCTSLLRGLVQLDTVYANVGLLDTAGRVVCSSTTVPVNGNFASFDWFQQVKSGQAFGYGRARIGVAVQRPVVGISHGLRNESGQLLGVLLVTLDLIRWSDSWARMALPAGSVIVMQDENAQVISRYPDPEAWIGKSTAEPYQQFRQKYPSGAGLGQGLEGVPRYYAEQALPAMESRQWTVLVGVPAAPLLEQARARLLEGVLAAAVIFAGTLALAWLMATRLAAPLARLAQTARAVAAGERGARAEVAHGGEFHDVALEFNRMLDARALAELRADRLARFYAALSQTNQAILRIGDKRAMLDEICRICVAAGHAKLAVVGILEGTVLKLAGSSSAEVGPHYIGMTRPFDMARPEDADTAIGRALREGEHQILNDFPNQAATAEWRQRARDEGVGAMASFPIRRGGQVAGVMTLHVAEADFFDPPLVELLDDMAEDLSFALDSRRAAAAQASAEAASRAKTEFLSRIGHELRTPLNAVLGFAQVLGGPGQEPLSAAQALQVERIREAGWHLLALIDDILDVAAVEAGRLRIHLATVDVSGEIAAALALCAEPAEHAGVHLASQTPAGRPLLALCDAVRLRQILINLLTNAIKYNRAGGSVVISLRPTYVRPLRVQIEIRDDGVGMNPAQLAQLFEPFNRLGRESGPVKGTGIGLALTRQLVELMGGSIDVQSAPDEGTRVLLSLPLMEGEGEGEGVIREPASASLPPPAPAGDEDRQQPLHGRLLYVEDNEVNVIVLREFLGRWPGLTLDTAEDGAQGLARAAALRPDLLLLDLHLPDMDGYELLGRLQAAPETAGLRVVMLSASAMPEEVARARAAGALDYWTKPLDFTRLERDLRELLLAR